MINKLFSTQQQQSLFPSCLYFILSFVFLKATSSTPSPRPLPRPSSPPLIRLSMSPLVPVTFYHVCLCASIWALKRFATTLSRFNWQPVCLYTNVCVCVCVRLVRRCLSPAVFTIDKRQHWQHRRFRFPPRSFSMTFLRCIYSNLLTLLYCSEKVSIKHRHTHTLIQISIRVTGYFETPILYQSSQYMQSFIIRWKPDERGRLASATTVFLSIFSAHILHSIFTES